MKHSSIPLSQTVVTLCKMHNIKDVVISPGSRNAPLTIGFTHDNYFNAYSIVDERCAAFFALGIAQQKRQPAALVCTSGSALLNYFPAIAEAFYNEIPLVVLSADRPEFLVGVGDGQTIHQKNVYGRHVHYNGRLKLDIRDHISSYQFPREQLGSKTKNNSGLKEIQEDIQSFNEYEIHKALSIAYQKSGPVHLNVPFEEPLYKTRNDLMISPQPFKWQHDNKEEDEIGIKELKKAWKSAKRKLILVGVLPPNSIEEKWINALAIQPDVIVFTETTSNLYHEDFFPCIDQMIGPLDSDGFKALQPDLLITLGGLVVSKKIKALLRQYKPQKHFHLGKQRANDTFFCLNHHIALDVNSVFEKLHLVVTKQEYSKYKSHWLQVKAHRLQKHREYEDLIPYSDFTVFRDVLDAIPTQIQLQIANSSAIRYAQLFKLNPTIEVFCNRGTSGIDGSTSTAIGAAVAAKKQVVFITGDLSFFYDSNALWNNYVPSSFRIILINNLGGGIFRILPGHKDSDNFDTFFETKHQLNASHLCEMYNFKYEKASNTKEIQESLKSFFAASKCPKVLEIFTPDRLNDKILLDYFTFIK